MGTLKISDNVYSVGVLNPGLRVFDVIMKTEYGTSYNAYLIKGKKIALVDTVHETFFDEYLQNIQSLVDVSQIEYIIMNHTEPDHSGSIGRLLEINPNIKIVASAAGLKYIKGVANADFASITAKDGETLDLGNTSLKFINAPFLHWPDSIFTYYEDEAMLFSCDFLGCHYCEPRMFDTQISYPKKYSEAFDYYFKCIFAPFKKYVNDGLDKIENLKINFVLTSHGPILTSTARHAMDLYRKYSTQIKNDPKRILIAYCSAYEYTELLAQEISKGAQSRGVCVDCHDIIDCNFEHLEELANSADGIMIGSPTINRDAVRPVWNLISSIDAIVNKGKLCTSFGSYGWSGEAVGMIRSRLESLGLKFFGDGLKVNFKPSETDLGTAFKLGVDFADEVLK